MLLIKLIDAAAQLAYLLLFARVIISWLPHDPYHPIIQYIYRLSDPIMRPFQNLIPPHSIGIDLSPIFAFLAIKVVRNVLIRLLVGF